MYKWFIGPVVVVSVLGLIAAIFVWGIISGVGPAYDEGGLISFEESPTAAQILVEPLSPYLTRITDFENDVVCYQFTNRKRVGDRPSRGGALAVSCVSVEEGEVQ